MFFTSAWTSYRPISWLFIYIMSKLFEKLDLLLWIYSKFQVSSGEVKTRTCDVELLACTQKTLGDLWRLHIISCEEYQLDFKRRNMRYIYPSDISKIA